jgi:hypothetical protein
MSQNKSFKTLNKTKRDAIKKRAQQLKSENKGRSNSAVLAVLKSELLELCPSMNSIALWCRGLKDQRLNRDIVFTREKRLKYMREYAKKQRSDPESRARKQAYMRAYYENHK